MRKFAITLAFIVLTAALIVGVRMIISDYHGDQHTPDAVASVFTPAPETPSATQTPTLAPTSATPRPRATSSSPLPATAQPTTDPQLAAQYAGRWSGELSLDLRANGTAKFTTSDGGTATAMLHKAPNGLTGVVTKADGSKIGLQPGDSVTATTVQFGLLDVAFGGGKLNGALLYRNAKLPASTLKPYVGDKWYAGARTMHIQQDSTGSMAWDLVPCGDTTCADQVQLLFDAAMQDGSIVGVVTQSQLVQSDGQPAVAAPDSDEPQPESGDAFQLQHSGDQLLTITWDDQATALNDGNHNWCWSGVQYPDGTCM